MFNFLDLNFIITILVVIVAIIVIRVLLKVVTKNRFIKIAIVGIFLILVVIGIYRFNYVYNNIYYESGGSYVYGLVKVINTTTNTIQIDSTKTNFSSGGTGKIIVKYTDKTLILNDNNKSKRITEKDIGYGDVVQIICKEDKLENGKTEVTALRIIKQK